LEYIVTDSDYEFVKVPKAKGASVVASVDVKSQSAPLVTIDVKQTNPNYFSALGKKAENTQASDPNWVKAVLSRARISKVSARGGTHKIIREMLVGGFAITGSANTATFSSQALSPIGVQDWSGFAALFDIARVLKVRICMSPYTSAQPTQQCYWVATWDPSNSAPYSSSADQLTGQHFIGPVSFNSVNSTTLSMTKTGYFDLTVKLPTPKEQIANNNASAGIVGGGWIATSDTNYICGWFKTFFSAGGGAIVCNLNCQVFYDVEFASRT